MDIKDVLLTEQEYADTYMEAVTGKLNTASILRITEGHNAQKKAQCLKLIEWMETNRVIGKQDSLVSELKALLEG